MSPIVGWDLKNIVSDGSTFPTYYLNECSAIGGKLYYGPFGQLNFTNRNRNRAPIKQNEIKIK